MYYTVCKYVVKILCFLVPLQLSKRYKVCNMFYNLPLFISKYFEIYFQTSIVKRCHQELRLLAKIYISPNF